MANGKDDGRDEHGRYTRVRAKQWRGWKICMACQVGLHGMCDSPVCQCPLSDCVNARARMRRQHWRENR